MRLLIAVLLLVLGRSAFAGQEVPFPELNSETYCRELVAKMLDKDEQRAENEKCLAGEARYKSKLSPLWHLLPPDTQKMVIDQHFQEEQHHTYGIAAQYVAQGAGKACIDGRLACEPDVATTDPLFTALNSGFYCQAGPATDVGKCIEVETVLKSNLAFYWTSIDREQRNQCLSLFLDVRRSPFMSLINCVAPQIGWECLSEKRDCRPKD